MSNAKTFCSQCGQDFSAAACGPTHAIRAQEAQLQRRIDNAGACSHLNCAIWFIRLANKLWPFVHSAGLVETLEQLKAKIRAELPANTNQLRGCAELRRRRSEIPPSERSASSAVK